MHICLLQTDICWAAVADNITAAEAAIAAHPGADLYVLPEMWATGFVVNPDAATAGDGATALEWMRGTSLRLGTTLAGSLPLAGENGFTNTLVVATDGDTTTYDKRHLFTYGGEDRYYRAGNSRVVVRLGEWRVLLQVCYDLRFPVFARCVEADYDAILYVANWPASRRHVWDVLLQARAIENQCYVIGVNRTGTDPVCTYDGGTAVVSPRGRIVDILDDKPGALCFDLSAADLADLHRFRTKFPALADADRFHLSR